MIINMIINTDPITKYTNVQFVLIYQFIKNIYSFLVFFSNNSVYKRYKK